MSNDPLIGTEVSNYRIDAVIGRGGMGVVYLARDPSGQLVALKLMAPDLVGNEQFRERFIREAEAGLAHPNVVPIYAAGEDRDLLYIAMHYVEGADLKAIIETEGRLLPARTARIIDQAAAALDFAHESGVVHRDVKPQNILVQALEEGGEFEHAYLSDFGLIKNVSSRSSFTDSAYLMGTVHYMSPEQIEGNEIDGRADVYALGCVAYECLTGSVPFEKSSELAVLWAHVNDPIPKVTAKVPVLSEGLNEIVATAMAKSPDDRYLTAGDLSSALKRELGVSDKRPASVWSSGKRPRPGARLARKPSYPAPATPRTHSRVGLLVAAALALGVIPPVFGRLTDRSPSVAAKLERAVEADTGNGAVPEAGQNGSKSFEDEHRDDSKLKKDRKGNVKRRGAPVLNSLLAAETERLVPEDVSHAPVAYRNPALKDLSIVFSSRRDKQGSGGAGYADRSEIYVMRGDGSDQTRLTFTPSVSFSFNPHMSASGNIAFTSDRNGSFDIYTMDSTGGSLARLTDNPGCEYEPKWSPDGSRIVYTQGPPGAILCGPGEFSLWTIEVATGERQLIARGASYVDGAVWSPDGRRIAYTGTLGNRLEIFVSDADGGNARPLTRSRPDESWPAWSPDGRHIAFVRKGAIFKMNLASRTVTRLTQTSVDTDPDWSPDGSKIIFTSRREGHEQLYVMDSDGSNETNLAPSPSGDGDASWQQPAMRSVSVSRDGTATEGSVRSLVSSCRFEQTVHLQRRTSKGWKVLETVRTDSTGNFAVRAQMGGSLRVFVPFSISRGTPCGLASRRL